MQVEEQKGADNAPFFPDRIVSGIIWICGALSTLLILWIFVQICVAVTFRYVIDRPLQWSDEMIGYLLVAAVMMGAAEALRRNDHIAIDLLTNRLPPRLQRAQAVFAQCCVIAFAVVVGVSIWDAISFAHAFGSYSVGYIEIQTWIPQVPVLIGSVLLALMAALRLSQTIRGRA
ncbi:TRAP transporter small permease [Ruegeria marina]|uniref:TRAP transporter small permease protein n=1 Tax=Ruegeria marina TaxID=639004 RepID=A0A1G6VRU9_9RHOB|nr:TRAP transporter small permease [Ruegeria marina]SDD55566.1 TRAP-type C4-dicarboxylate transport system, small permease component [Ruegeria marina]